MMTRIIITSSITSNSKTPCLKCGEQLRLYGVPEKTSCGCGAHYELISSQIIDQNVRLEYDFTGFVCTFKNYTTACYKTCPSPNMYCRDHCSDDVIEKAKSDIQYAEKRVVEAQDKLEAVESSKKMWLVSDMSGLGDDK
jgi:hypothetical protein